MTLKQDCPLCRTVVTQFVDGEERIDIVSGGAIFYSPSTSIIAISTTTTLTSPSANAALNRAGEILRARRLEILEVCLSEMRVSLEADVQRRAFDKGELMDAFNVAQLWAIHTVVNYKSQNKVRDKGTGRKSCLLPSWCREFLHYVSRSETSSTDILERILTFRLNGSGENRKTLAELRGHLLRILTEDRSPDWWYTVEDILSKGTPYLLDS